MKPAVQIDSNLSLTFNEAVRAGTGNIRIAGGGQTLSIPVTSSQISFSGDVMTINPTANLLANTRYTVTMPTGVVKDQAGNNFAGIANTSRFNFTTRPRPELEPVMNGPSWSTSPPTTTWNHSPFLI